MATNVNIWFENWRYSGQQVRVPQAQAVVRIEWTDDEGVQRTWEDTVTWPNDFSSLSDQKRKEILEELMIRIARIRLGFEGVG